MRNNDQIYLDQVIAGNIRTELIRRNWPYEILADKTGISHDNIRSLMCGRTTFDVWRLYKIAKALRVNPMRLAPRKVEDA